MLGTLYIQVAQKSKPLWNDQRIVLIVLKPVNEIRFIRQIKVWIKHYNIMRDLLSDLYNYAWPSN